MNEQRCDCGRPTSGAWLCEKCAKTLAYAIAHVGVYHDDLSTLAAKQTRYGTQATKGSIGKAQPLPVDSRFLSTTNGAESAGHRVRAETRNTMTTWCRVVMDEQPPLEEKLGAVCDNCLHTTCIELRTIKRRRHPRDTMSSMAAYLLRQQRHILSQQWVPEMLDEMHDCEKRLARLVDRPAQKWYAGKCGFADENGVCEAELYATTEKGRTTCPGCGIEHDVAERRDFLLKEAKEYPVTATEAAHALMAWTDYAGTEERLVDRIRKWRDRDKLQVLDVTGLLGRDRHLYRLGDIQDLLVGAAQERQQEIVAAT